ncbi:PH domain-containing protein [Serinibacter arcticus]|uniref:Membrane-flanked domain n=1 Tax=Serinibacter arcticus TaxID=1655435 RepID=A0A4Z1DWE3_9MICO|nr:PH domain-containing protein [Serinibacter arcticus]TGO03915.1 membrane-flanked domain [Serinibacter arcticus]
MTAPSPRVDDEASVPDDDEHLPDPGDPRWQRRPLRSLVVQCVRTLLTSGALVAWIWRNEIEGWVRGEELEVGFAVVAGGVVLGVALLIVIGHAAGWHRYRFAVTDHGLHVRSGVLSTVATTYAPERIDGVEIREPLLERIAGLATLKVEVSGGGTSGTEIPGLPLEAARAWRSRLLEHRHEVVAKRVAAGVATAGTSPGADGDDGDDGDGDGDGVSNGAGADAAAAPPEDRGRLVLALGPDRARRYTLRSVQPWLAAAACLVFFVLAVLDAIQGGVAAAIGLVIAAGAAGVGAVRSAIERWRRVATWEVHDAGGDLAVSRGRLNRRRTTVRAGRVSAIDLSQGPIDRRSGWWTLTVSVTALGSSTGEDGAGTVAVAASVDEVVPLVATLMSGLDEAMLTEVRTALRAARPPSTWIGSQRYGRLLAPISWESHGLLVDASHVLSRTGRWTRSVRVIDRARIQTTALEQDPRDRRHGGANLTVHLPPGPVARTVWPYLELERATALRDELVLSRPRGDARRAEGGARPGPVA